MNTVATTPRSFFARIWIYSLEMFPVLIYLPYVLALYICLNFSTQALSGQDIVLDVYGVSGMITAFFMMLLMRTFDDLKDIEIDKGLFPERATPRGAVLKSDIRILSMTSFVILVATNVLFAQDTLLIFAGMMVYALLTFKWFFAEEIHRKNLFLTMMTHQPLPLAINFFLIHTALASGTNYDPFTLNHFVLLLIFSLPVTAWETSRKIRSKDMETDYETFSMIFGARGATLIPFVCLLLAGSLSVYIGALLGFGTSFFVVIALLLVYVIYYYGRFLIRPVNEYNVLKTTAMVFATGMFFNMLVHIVMQFNVTNQL